MMFINRSRFAALAAALICLSGCTAGQSLAGDDKQSDLSVTEKPGASVEIKFEAPEALAVGEYGVLKLTVKDYYDTGTLSLTARPEDGLRLVSETGRKEVSMSGNHPHVWELDIVGVRDGVFYVNVGAMVDVAGENQSARAFSGRVNIGDISKAKLSDAEKRNGVLSEDGSRVIMPATETIK